MKERSWAAWLALAGGVAVASFAVIAQNPPKAEPANAYPTVFSAARAMEHVKAIAREPHPTGSEAITKVRTEILQRLKAIGVEAEVQTPKDKSWAERNIVARIKGGGVPGRRAVLLCAHYDSVRGGPGAGDNASGVAVVLETLRAYKAGPRYDRDVIALFDDGEESGMRGAKMFVEEHPWARFVGVVLNVDARGNHGPSIMFETSARNGWLIEKFAEVTPHPIATSMSMDLYRIMPNDTDLSVFKRAGIDGLNYVFSRGISSYHSPEDTPENLDLRSVQHQGENFLAMTRRLAGNDLDSVRADDVIYFTYLNRGVIYYPAKLALPFALGLAGLYVLTVVVGLIMGRVKLGQILVGIVAWFVAAFLSIFVVGGYWVVLRDILSDLGVQASRIDLPILAFGGLIAALVTLGVERLAMKGRSIESLSLGALGWWVALAVLTSIFLPGSSYLLTWPAAFSLLGMNSLMMMRRGSGLAREAYLIGCLPALILFPPLIREMFEGLSLRLVGPMMILVVLFIGGILPLFAPLVVPQRED